MIRPASRRLFALVISLSMVAGLAVPAAAVDGNKFVSLTNEKRASVGLGPVSLHSAVDKIAVERANHMAKYDAWSHDMTYVKNRLNQLGVCYTGYGEIIAYNTRSDYHPSQSIEQWWKSPGHKDVMTGNYNAAGGSHARSSKTSRNYAAMIFVKTCSSGTSKSTQVTRLAGADRYATAATISKSRFGGGAGTAFIATGATFPDALAGAPAAAKAKGPILLTLRGSLPTATANELSRLGPSKIVVLGGKSAVSDSVVSKLKKFTSNVVRWQGADRYATAAKISSSSFGSGVGVAYVATSKTFPDALSGGAVAGKLGGPILLVDRNAVPGATAKELNRLNPGKIIVLGGRSVVSDGVVSALGRYTRSVGRLAGADRYATSVKISKSAYGGGSKAAFVATGTNFPDGLAGGPVAALLPGPLLLVSPTELPSNVKSELQRLGPSRVFVLGGSGVVSDRVVRSIKNALP